MAPAEAGYLQILLKRLKPEAYTSDQAEAILSHQTLEARQGHLALCIGQRPGHGSATTLPSGSTTAVASGDASSKDRNPMSSGECSITGEAPLEG
jgi:hypothetical protein